MRNFTFKQKDGSLVSIEAKDIQSAQAKFKKNYPQPEEEGKSKGGGKSKSKKTNED